MSAPYGHFKEAHSFADQADEHARMCGLLHHPEEELGAEFETWDRVRDRASVHLPGRSDSPFGSVALTIVSFSRSDAPKPRAA